MKEDIKKILESDLIENYILGLTSGDETRKIESLIASSEDIRKVYNDLQDVIQEMTQKTAINPPESLRKRVLDAIYEEKESKERIFSFKPYAIAASLAALLFATIGFIQWSQKKQLEINNLIVVEQLRELEAINNMNTAFIDSLSSELAIINDPLTERFVLQGNEKSKEFVSIAYWNKNEKTALLELVNLPEPGQDKCYQMWYDIDGEMVSAGIIPDAENSIRLRFEENAESINITIEPEGGSQHPTVSNLIANVYI